jgi:hypothetical protein
MNLAAECNDFRLGHGFFLIANGFLVISRATTLWFLPAALLTLAVARMVVPETDTV